MADPVVGYNGSAKIGPALSAVAINKVTKWSFKTQRDKTEQGPWVGDPNKVTTVGGKLGSLDIEGDVVVGGDAGVQDAVDAYENATNDRLELIAEDGFAVTFATPAYLTAEISVDAGKGQTWKISVEGAYAITQDT
jgi:hypothetical protein